MSSQQQVKKLVTHTRNCLCAECQAHYYGVATYDIALKDLPINHRTSVLNSSVVDSRMRSKNKEWK